MKHLIKISISLFIIFNFLISFSQTKKEVTFSSKDNVKITADVYLTKDVNAPFILLFHQAWFSRGEYIETALKFNKLGFNCIAADQRSGKKVNGIENKTCKDAQNKGMKTKYPDAYPDLEATFEYVKKTYKPKKIIVLGSSYSSSLVFILAAKHKEIQAVLSFSPGEYFKFENKKISDWANEVDCPVFVTSSKKEATECSQIFKNVNNKSSIQFIPKNKGFHGSKVLWSSKEGNEEYWKAVKSFLTKYTSHKTMESLVPNLMVINVNKTIDYYKENFDFRLIMKVPEKGKPEWAMMKNGNATIMFQEKESISKELKSLQNMTIGATMNLYIRTKDVKELYNRLKKTQKIEKELATTFFGTTEFSIIDLNGYILTFSEMNE